MTRIFIIEDDPVVSKELARVLELSGYEASVFAGSFSTAAAAAVAANPDLVLLDLKLPESDGHEICHDIREAASVPIIMLTSSESEFDEVLSMNIGADDYITKPYRPAVLLARIEAALRRTAASGAASVIEHNGLTLDIGDGTVTFNGASAELTRNEQCILTVLLTHAGTFVSRSEIMCELWESDEFIGDNTLTVNVNRLRKVLERIGVPSDYLVTKRGVGYKV